MKLTPDQLSHAVEVMREYLNAPPTPDGKTLSEASTELDKERAALIDSQLKPLVEGYLAGRVGLGEFKTKNDGINKRQNIWGFGGIKGQMFFNMVMNVAHDNAECDQEIKAAIAIPANEEMARSRIRTFASYARRIGENYVEGGGTKQRRPKVGSVPFFLSYFWQIQNRRVWPVYHTNGVNTMRDLNLWEPSNDLADDYVVFKQIYEELADAFSKATGMHFDLYGIEHVFWFKGGNPYAAAKPVPENGDTETEYSGAVLEEVAIPDRLPESYVPPLIAILPQIAQNAKGLDAAAKASGTALERAFEKRIDAALQILGYETKLLGQGSGRVPDGIALDHDNLYAVLWDGKVRKDGYSMGTDDRPIREYIKTQRQALKGQRLRKFYYVLVSGGFAHEFDDEIALIKMETDISEVCLLEADALVAMVDAKLRNPLQVDLGPDGIQRLFNNGGIITVEKVRENLSW
jgi:hypothetical protein